jgi:pyrimidine operon attenuation protein/uracil phosphoribosyltransferase
MSFEAGRATDKSGGRQTGEVVFLNATVLMDGAAVARAVRRVALEIAERDSGVRDAVLVGIRTRGAPLARRIQAVIAEFAGAKLPLGLLDINLYRDDFNRIGIQAEIRETHIPFSVESRRVVLVDDVLYTGRTVRAALDAVIDLGRPRRIELAVLIDRGLRELPIQADFIGQTVAASAETEVAVCLTETDGRDEVLLKGGKA